MNWLGFAKLMHAIYGPGLPDLAAIEKQGLLAVKIAQVFALRIDFLNEKKCRHLTTLYRSTMHLPPVEVSTLLNRGTDRLFQDRFAFIQTSALASASVGQVHRGRLHNGDEVVVKIIKQDFAKRFTADIQSLKRLFKLAIMFYPKLQKVADPVGILEHIEDYTLTELNLLNEIRGQETLRAIQEDHKNTFDLSKLKFARIYRDLSSRTVLVSEYVEGETFDAMLQQGRLPYAQLLELFHIHGFYMFAVGTFHGDIHPGNIILSNGCICFIDTSAICSTGPKIRKGLFSFFSGLAYWDYEKCAYFLNRMADTEISGKRYADFEKKFISLYSDFTDSTVSKVSLTQRMMETIKLGVHSGMVFEQGIFSIIKSLMYLDGMVLRCNPDAVLIKDMRPFLEESKPFVPGS